MKLQINLHSFHFIHPSFFVYGFVSKRVNKHTVIPLIDINITEGAEKTHTLLNCHPRALNPVTPWEVTGASTLPGYFL